MGWKSKVAAGALALALSTVTVWEGFSRKVYLDPVGIPTVCYGHVDSTLELGQEFSMAACNKLLSQDLMKAADSVSRRVTYPIKDYTKAALISFVYNVGIGNFERSTLLKLLNQGKIIEACHELPKWVYAKGKKLKGLENRRKAEMEMCLGN